MNWYLKIHLGTFYRLAYYSAHTEKTTNKWSERERRRMAQETPEVAPISFKEKFNSRSVTVYWPPYTNEHTQTQTQILQGPVTEPKLSALRHIFRSSVRRVEINNNIMMGKINQKSSFSSFFLSKNLKNRQRFFLCKILTFVCMKNNSSTNL